MTSCDELLPASSIAVLELRHRIKNLVAITQALVTHSLRHAANVDKAAVVIAERLKAVSASVDVLLRSDWEAVDLDDLTKLALSHAISFPGRVHVSGPRVSIPGDWVTMLILALHELETNALKYGALSTQEGSIDLRWSLVGSADAPVLWLQWTENGGPIITNPGRAGFGSRLATTLLQRHLRGTVDLEIVPSGLTWRLLAALPGASS